MAFSLVRSRQRRHLLAALVGIAAIASGVSVGLKGNGPDPATIGVGSGVVTYELVQMDPGFEQSTDGRVIGTVLFEVLPDENLRVELFPGMTASQVNGFSDTAVIYER